MKHRELLTELAERLELPEEALAGAAKLTVTGNSRLLIENHLGIMEYGTERIVVRHTAGKLQIMGAKLCLKAMNRRELLIAGSIQTVEWM